MTLLPHKIKLNWTHITSLEDMDAKKQFLSSCGGVYLWISPLKVKRVLYIGTAKNFQKRFFDHLSSQIKGGYTEFFYDGYDDLLKYFADEIYADGRDVDFFKAKENLNEKFTFPVGCFNQEFSFRRIIPAQEKMQNRLNFINALEFAVAPIDFSLAGLSAEQLSEQVEAILQKKISQTYVDILNQKYGKSIRHLGVRGTKKNASLIGSVLENPTLECDLIHSGEIESLPAELLAVSSNHLLAAA